MEHARANVVQVQTAARALLASVPLMHQEAMEARVFPGSELQCFLNAVGSDITLPFQNRASWELLAWALLEVLAFGLGLAGTGTPHFARWSKGTGVRRG